MDRTKAEPKGDYFFYKINDMKNSNSKVFLRQVKELHFPSLYSILSLLNPNWNEKDK